MPKAVLISILLSQLDFLALIVLFDDDSSITALWTVLSLAGVDETGVTKLNGAAFGFSFLSIVEMRTVHLGARIW
jgi:hypothetical protein